MKEKDKSLQHDYTLGKVPPQDIPSEEAVLGAILLEKDALFRVIDILIPECFYKENHKRIYKAVMQVFEDMNPIDILTVINKVNENGDLDLIGGPYAITSLTSLRL